MLLSPIVPSISDPVLRPTPMPIGSRPDARRSALKPSKRVVHREAGAQRIVGIVEQGHDGIADILVDEAVMGTDDRPQCAPEKC